MNLILYVSRILVGSLFIISGLVKANDSLGFSYKLVEYFGEKALNLPALEPFALELAIFICLGEIVLGLAVLIGGRPKLTAALLMFMILFFTWLTWYTATCDPLAEITVMRDGVEVTETKECVQECGCFGNAIPLTPWESFYKDIVLLFFITIITVGAFASDRIRFNTYKDDIFILPASLILIALFSKLFLDWWFPAIFTAILLALYLGVKKLVASEKTLKAELLVIVLSFAACIAFQYQTLVHLPMKDYRPYAVGNSIREGMMSAEDLGKEPPVYAVEYLFTNTTTGKDSVVLSTDYLEKKLYNDENFKRLYTVKTYEGNTIKLKDGYEPPIMDFALSDYEANDLTETIIQDPGAVFLQISYDISKAEVSCIKEINAFAKAAQEKGHRYFGVSSSSAEEVDTWRHEYQAAYPFLVCDEKVLKTIVRANPGIILIRDGVVLGMWAGCDLPDFSEVQELLQ
jgi:uncharacterized membrane protein YphA (DoxX/SURF4 family)